jgi:hypothetical protein
MPNSASFQPHLTANDARPAPKHPVNVRPSQLFGVSVMYRVELVELNLAALRIRRCPLSAQPAAAPCIKLVSLLPLLIPRRAWHGRRDPITSFPQGHMIR